MSKKARKKIMWNTAKVMLIMGSVVTGLGLLTKTAMVAHGIVLNILGIGMPFVEPSGYRRLFDAAQRDLVELINVWESKYGDCLY